MDWNQEAEKLVADTDFGKYSISRKGLAQYLHVELDSGDEVHEVVSDLNNLPAALRAAEADLEYRNNTWAAL